MKESIRFPFFAMLALLFAACTNEDVTPESSDWLTDAPVAINVGSVGTRAGYDKGDIIDEGSLGFWLDQGSASYNAANLEVKCEAGEWTPQGRLRWRNATDEAAFAAAYPYDADGVYEVKLPADQFNSDMLPFDLLYAEGRVKGGDGAVNIVFSHALAQLKVKLTFGEALGTNPQIKNMTLSNAALDGTFTVRDADGRCAWSNQGNRGKVTLVKNYHAEFECLLIPQTIEDYYITVDAVVGGIEKQYRFESAGLVLEQGKSYTLPLQVGKSQHPYVDLGLPSGTLWAAYNVGATAPEECGDYFAWGETAPKEYYNYSNEGDYKHGVFDGDAAPDYGLTKYNSTDGLTTLEPVDDAATANWGTPWRMPTVTECDELREECTWTWTALNGMNGYEVKGSNGNTIFLPAAGYYFSAVVSKGGQGRYWSSTRYLVHIYAAEIFFYADGVNHNDETRFGGRSVRAVRTR